MITEALLNLLFGIINAAISVIPSAPAPAWVSSANGLLATVFEAGAGLGVWIPWGTVGTVFATVMACVGIGFTIKVIRIAASFMSGGGGSAA